MAKARRVEARIVPAARNKVAREYFFARDDVSVIIGPLGCLPADAEYLSPTGWRRMDAYVGGEVAAWSPDGALRFEVPREVVRGPATEWCSFANDSLSMRLSPDHRMPLYDYQGRFVVRYAEDVVRAPSSYRVPTTFDPGLPDLAISDDALRLRVAINADGHHPHVGLQTLVTVRKERKKTRLRQLLEACEIAYEERVSPSRPTETRFVFRWPAYRPRKRYDGDFWRLSRRQLAVVLDEVKWWDGLATTEETRFFTTSEADADFVQYAAHATGGRATIRWKRGRGNEQPCATVYVAREGSAKASVRIRNTTKLSREVAKVGETQHCFVTTTGFFVARDRGCVFVTGNSAKTYTTMQRILAIACDQAPNAQGVRYTKGGVLRNTWPELERVTLADIERFFGPMGAKITRGIPPTFALKLRLGDGTLVDLQMDFVAGLDQADSEEKMRGYQWTWCWGNEGRQIPLGVFGMAIARTGRYPSPATEGAGPTWRGGMIDTNAFDVDHPLHKLMLSPPPGWRFYIQPPGVTREHPDAPWVKNPAREYPPDQDEGYYERIAAGRPDDWVRVNLANEFIFHVDGKPVHPQYRDAVHCAAAPIALRRDLALTLGIDFGRTPAATVWQYDAAMDRWSGLAEFVTQDLSASLFAPTLRRWLDREFAGIPLYAWGDPAGDRAGQTVETTPIQVLRAHGIPCGPAPSNVALLRRSALAKPMMRVAMDGRPSFLISPTCRMLRKGLQGGYHYKRMQIAGTERYTDEPDKNEFSHVVESAEYALLGGGERATARDVRYAADEDDDEEPQYAVMEGV